MYVYILRCCNGSLYTGVTSDIQNRLALHISGKGAKYTRAFGVLGIELVLPVLNRPIALKIEYKIKQLTRTKKEILIKRYNQWI